MDKTCWSCGHWLLGLGCCVEGVNDFVPTEVDYVCHKWLPEGMEETVTDFSDIGEGDGTTWAENETLKDDDSDL